jgi:hypothetical protein
MSENLALAKKRLFWLAKRWKVWLDKTNVPFVRSPKISFKKCAVDKK